MINFNAINFKDNSNKILTKKKRKHFLKRITLTKVIVCFIIRYIKKNTIAVEGDFEWKSTSTFRISKGTLCNLITN